MKKLVLLGATMLRTVSLRAFNNKGGWKLDAEGKIEVKDGNPVWVDANGEEKTLGADTVTRLNGEAQRHREAKEAAEAELKKYEHNGKRIDPAAALKAIDTVANIDAKKLIDAGEVEKVRTQIQTEFTNQLAEKDKAIADLSGKIDNMTISGVFTNSEFIKEKVAMPSDFVQKYFSESFKVENGKIAAYDKAGNRLMSKARIGEFAEGDEALELLIDAHPQKDVILKAANHQGSGNNGGGGQRTTTGKTIKRSEYNTYSPGKQAEIGQAVGRGEMSIVD